MPAAAPRSLSLPFALLIIAPGLIFAPSRADAEPGLQVYWYHDIGSHGSIDAIDWSVPDRMTRADRIYWASTNAPWEADAPSDQFAVRIVGSIRAHTDGEYHFRLGSDDGSRMYIDDEMLIDHDGHHSMSYRTGQATLDAGYHPIEIFYFEASGGAGLHLEWRPPGAPGWTTVAPSAFAALDATIEIDWYFADHAVAALEDIDWSGPTLSTSEVEINWPLRSGGFIPDSPGDRFALRARTRIVIPESGMYRFELGSDDGARLRVDGHTIIDENRIQSFGWADAELFLTAGVKNLELLYFQGSGDAGLVLMWQGPTDPAPVVIPSSAFRSPTGTARPRVTGWRERPRLESER